MTSNSPEFLAYEYQRITEELVYCRKQYAFLDTADCGEPIPNLMEDLANLQDSIQYLSAELKVITDQIRK